MEHQKDSRYDTGNAFYDALRLMCDVSFAVLPRDVAHRLGEFEKNVWGGVRWFADKQVGWIDDCLTGGDRLRAEWQRRSDRHNHSRDTGGTTASHTAYETPESI